MITRFLQLTRYCAALGLMSASALAATQELTEKKWELGVGVGALSGPDYRGSDEYRTYTAPIPYVIYRGKYIRSDREGLRGRFLRTERYELTFSASASVTPDSDKSSLRDGMPRLGSTVEIGPSVNINLSGGSLSQGWQLQLPWRAVYAIDDDRSGYMGHLFQPQLQFRERWGEWNFGYRAGITFGSRDYHDHYYSVAPEFATERRAEFTATGGYSGWFNQFTLTRKLAIADKNTILALFVRYDSLEETKIRNSPLVATDSSWRGGLAFIWVIK